MRNVRCLPVPKEHLTPIWSVVSALLAKAVATAPGKLSVEDVLDGAYNGTYLLWIILIDEKIVATVTTRIIAYPKCRAMALDWIGGERMREWLSPAMRVMKEHALRNNCAHLEGYGREAWDRWGRREGWRPDYVAFKMDLTDGELPV